MSESKPFWKQAAELLGFDSAPREPSVSAALDALPQELQDVARQQVAENSGADGWINVATSLGVEGKDPTVSTIFGHRSPVNQVELENVYRFEGIARKIVDIPVREMFRRGFSIEGDNAGEFVTFLKKKRIIADLQKLAKLGRLYGGAIGVMLVDDGQKDLEKPLNLANVRGISGINIFDRWQVSWFPEGLYTSPEHPKYMQPSKYLVFPMYGGSFWVHESRVLRYNGVYLPPRAEQMNTGWYDSVLQSPWDKLRALGETFGYSKNIIRNFIQETLSMEGVSKLIAAGNEKVLMDRMKILRVWKSVLNTIPLDATEKYEKSASTITGLPEMIDRFFQWLCADTDIPVSILFGRVSSGLSGTGDADSQHRLFYERIAEEQNNEMGPLVQRLLDIALAIKPGSPNAVFKTLPVNPSVTWLPLEEPSEQEKANTRLTNAQADSQRIQDGVLDPLEVRRARYAGPDNPSGEIRLEEEDLDDQSRE